MIGIDLLTKLLRENWAPLVFGGAAMGASTALMRDKQRIISSLQGMVMVVLRVLAPLVAAALVLFLGSLIVTGLNPLWDATRATTPIILGVAILALFLINGVLGDSEGEAARAKPLLWGAAALALCLLPLSLIAAISTGIRVVQYGWTPERLWAVTFIAMGMVTAVTYLIAVVRGLAARTGRLRRSNVGLALTLCALALLLSTPLSSFDALSTRDQIARLKDGRTKAGQFDYKALWFDFGPSGQAAIRRLAQDGATLAIRSAAAEVQKLDDRYDESKAELAAKAGDALDERLTILPATVALPGGLRERITRHDACDDDRTCTVRFAAGSDYAVIVAEPYKTCRDCGPDVVVLVRSGDVWGTAAEAFAVQTAPDANKLATAVRAGKVEVRDVPRQQVFIDGQPYGDTFPIPTKQPDTPQAP